MDRNSVIGLILIGLLVVVYSYFTAPTAEQRAAMQHQHDSLVTVHTREKHLQDSLALIGANKPVATSDTTQIADSTKTEMLKEQLGAFAAVAEGTEQFSTLENDLFKITFTNKGARFISGTEKI